MKKDKVKRAKGRTYLLSCGNKKVKGKVVCIHSGMPFWICYECASKQAKEWYQYGKDDEFKRVTRILKKSFPKRFSEVVKR